MWVTWWAITYNYMYMYICTGIYVQVHCIISFAIAIFWRKSVFVVTK